MSNFMKPILPYVLLVSLLVLTLCTREQQPTAEEVAHIEAVDSLAIELDEQIDAAAIEADENEQAIDALLEDI